MRMYSPEWEAIKDLQYTPRMLDIQFDFGVGEIPEDHGPALLAELLRHLPWLGETPGVAIHPVHGAPSGRNANLVLNRRVKLVMRLPVEREADAQALSGKTIDPGAGPLLLGDGKVKHLLPHATLYSHFLSYGDCEETVLLAEARRQLDEMGIKCGMIPGRQRKMHTPEGEISGHSLMLHDLGMLDSLTVQERGLGRHHLWGCGIFIPHKSIKEVSTV